MIRSTLNCLAILAAASFALSCATTGSSDTRKEMAVAAGFKTVKPTSPQQMEDLKKLPTDKFSRVTNGGKTYYVLPDRENGQLYVGTPKQYEAYQEDGQARQAVQDYNNATSPRTSETSEEDSDPNAELLENWDWSSTDGQTT